MGKGFTALLLLAALALLEGSVVPTLKQDKGEAIDKASLVCPPVYLWFCPLEENECETDGDCESVAEKCCNIACGVTVCRKAVSNKPHRGDCPPPRGLDEMFPPYGCIADYVGCSYDGECEEHEKCCPSNNCASYNECTKAVIHV